MAGIAGTACGIGTTHLAVLTANYFAGVCHDKTAIIELNAHGDFARIEKVCFGENKKDQCFHLLGIDWYKNADRSVIMDCKYHEYNRIILDLGTVDEINETDWLFCDIKIMLGACNEWKLRAFLEFIKSHVQKNNSGNWKLCTISGDRNLTKEIERRFKGSVFIIPFSADAFKIDKSMMKLMSQLFDE